MQRILTKREKIILFMAIGALVTSIVFNFVIDPVLTKSACLNKEISLTAAKLKKYLQLLSQKEQIKNQYDKFFESFRHFNNNIGKDASVNMLSEIENLAKESRIQILDIRPETPKNADLYKELLIVLRTQGDMEGYLRFLYNLENSAILLSVKSFQLNSKPNSQFLEGNFIISRISLD